MSANNQSPAMNPRLHTLWETPDIETATDDYAGRFSGAVGRWFLDHQARLTLDLLRPWPNGSVLEVGGGHAQLVSPLVAHGYRVMVTGSDAACRGRLEKTLPSSAVPFVVSDLISLPFPDQSFDVVMAFRLMAHMNSWRLFIGEMARVARHAVIVDYPERISANLLAEQFLGAKRAVEKNTRSYQCFRLGQLMEVFFGNGFERFDRRAQFFIPMAFHRAMGIAIISRAMESISRLLGLTHWFGSPVILRADRIRA